MDRRTYLLIAGATALTALSACNILGPAAYFAFGQPNVDARHELADRRTVIYVDDRHNTIPMHASRVRREIADRVTMDLIAQDVLTGDNAISSRDAMAVVRNQDREGRLMSIEAIGESVKAEQVIYIQMTNFRGSPDGYTPRPTASCRVKVVDVPDRLRLYPPPDAERPWDDIVVVSQPITPELYTSDDGRRQIESILAALIGDQVGKRFYQHIPKELGTRLNPR